ncbi:MAG: helix-turn-helix domain-containing protein [Cyanobacteria bacterium SZAS LIN-2]|nr:helix-turn-helix domain-containing protein [Cyanobacteria bacterium SZAS LIN-2]
MTEAERALALERFRLIQPFLDDGVPISALAHDGGLSVRTAQRWIKSYRNTGLVGLAKSKRGDAGRYKSPENVVAYVQALALGLQRRSTSSISRQTTVN